MDSNAYFELPAQTILPFLSYVSQHFEHVRRSQASQFPPLSQRVGPLLLVLCSPIIVGYPRLAIAWRDVRLGG